MSRKNLTRIVSAAAVTGALGFTATGQGAGLANADDDHGPWVPWVPWLPWYGEAELGRCFTCTSPQPSTTCT